MRNSLFLVLLTGGLLLGPSVTLGKPADYPLRCHGSAGMARAEGATLIVAFRRGEHPAGEGLEAGQCSWDDRGLRPNEPTRIIDRRPSIDEAKRTAAHINSGDIWTFWVYNAGTFFRAVDSYPGTPKRKPQRIDPN